MRSHRKVTHAFKIWSSLNIRLTSWRLLWSFESLLGWTCENIMSCSHSFKLLEWNKLIVRYSWKANIQTIHQCSGSRRDQLDEIWNLTHKLGGQYATSSTPGSSEVMAISDFSRKPEKNRFNELWMIKRGVGRVGISSKTFSGSTRKPDSKKMV